MIWHFWLSLFHLSNGLFYWWIFPCRRCEFPGAERAAGARQRDCPPGGGRGARPRPHNLSRRSGHRNLEVQA